MGYFLKSTAYTCGKLCRQYILLAGLALLCLFLPLLLGQGAQQALTEGTGFQGLTLAITAPEGDTMPALLEEVLGRMRDISRYCTFRAMDQSDALDALAAGEVVAVLEIPEDFVQGILYGTNPDVCLIVDENRPLESLLTLWVGQSAADLLGAVQAGIYQVLDAWEAAPVEGLSRDQVVTDINMIYINRTLNRQDTFTRQTLTATGTLPIALHYGLSLLVWLGMALAPLFFPVYQPDRLAARRRLRTIGRGSLLCCLSDLAACALVLLPVLLPALWFLCKGRFLPVFLCAAGLSLLCALWGSLCCLVTGSAARCGSAAFFLSLVSLFLAGGILPPVLLPQTLQGISTASPVTWFRNLAAAAAGYEFSLTPALLAGLAMLLLLPLLYRRRMDAREVDV